MTSPDEARPTILFVAVPQTLGGSNRSLTTLMSAIGDRAHRVLAAPPDGPFRAFAMERGAADEFLPLPHGSRLKRVGASLVIARWVWRNRRRLVSIHAQALTGLNLVTPAAALSGVPVIVRVSDPESSRWGRVLGPIVRGLIRDLRVAPVSEAARDVAVFNRLCKPEEAKVVPNPVDPEDVLATEHLASSSGLRVGFLGNATHRKGWDILLDVIELTLDSALEWKLFISPAGIPDRRQLDAFPAGRVEVVGRVTDVREAYAVCDVVFVPSRAESFCRVVAEAMVNGIPVVASDLPPIRTLVGEHEAGLLFTSGDATEAASALKRLVGDHELRSSMGAFAARRAIALRPESIIAEIAPLYGV
jgi:phosphatidylinositol alpha-mannosyltransferase